MGPVAARSSGAGAARQYGQKGTGLAPRHRRWLVRADEEDAGAPSLPRPAASGSIPAATSAGAAPAARLPPMAAPQCPNRTSGSHTRVLAGRLVARIVSLLLIPYLPHRD